MKLDIVYTYVDSTDINWLNEKQFYKGETTDYTNNIARSDTSLNEMLYSIRSLEQYFSDQYQHIYICTNNRKLPPFLKRHPNITIIYDRDLIGSPNFNSNAIESVLHLIPGLSEYYLYFNDDFILNRTLTLKDFLTKDNKLIWYAESNYFINLANSIPFITYFLPIDGGVNVARQKNYEKLGISGNPAISHSPRIFKKSQVEEFINVFKPQIHQLRKEKFRSDDSFTFVDVFCFWAEHKKYLNLLNTKRTIILIQSNPHYLIDLYNTWEMTDRKKAYFLCIEDIRTEKHIDPVLLDFLNNKFKHKCKYEKNW